MTMYISLLKLFSTITVDTIQANNKSNCYHTIYILTGIKHCERELLRNKIYILPHNTHSCAHIYLKRCLNTQKSWLSHFSYILTDWSCFAALLRLVPNMLESDGLRVTSSGVSVSSTSENFL